MALIIELLVNLLDIPIIYLLFGCFLQLRERQEKSYLYIISVVIVLLLYVARIAIGENLQFTQYNMLINLITYVSIIYIVSELLFVGNRSTKILLSFLLIIFAFFMEYFVYFITELLFNINFITTDLDTIHHGGIFASKFLSISIIYTANKYFKHSKSLPSEKKLYLLQAIIPLLSAVFFIIYPVFDSSNQGLDNTRYFIITVIFMLINIVHYIVFSFHQKVDNERYQVSLLLQEYSYKEEYYQSMERYQKEIRSIKHDMKNQLITLAAYIESPEKGKANEQVQQLLNEVITKEDMQYTMHPGINALLSAKYKIASELHITCDFDISISSDMKFEEKLIGSLLGNIIDNAIEACQQCTGIKYIKLKMVYFNKSLVISAENSCKNYVTHLKTNKKDNLSHGFGIKNMQYIVDQYHGNLDYRTTNTTFILDVILWENIN